MKKINKNIYFLFFPLLIISFISLFNLHQLNYQNLLIKQIIWYITTILIIIIFNKININKLFKLSWPIYIINIILLTLVLLIGPKTYGAKAWIKIGNLSFQPSELMKLSLSLLLANIGSKTKIKKYKDEFILIIKFIIITIIPSILVFLEPDTGAIIFYIIIFLSILFTCIHHKWLILIFLFIILLFIGSFIGLYIYQQDFLIKILGTSIFYRMDRIINFKKNIGYQLSNALTVIGSANLFNKSNHNILYIPEATTDFAFAYTIGNLGIFYGFIVILLYLIIIYYFLSNYFKLKNKKIKLFLISFINIFIFNIMINISMNLGLLPIIGIPLPFLSYGGSTILIYAIYIAIFIKSTKINI